MTRLYLMPPDERTVSETMTTSCGGSINSSSSSILATNALPVSEVPCSMRAHRSPATPLSHRDSKMRHDSFPYQRASEHDPVRLVRLRCRRHNVLDGLLTVRRGAIGGQHSGAGSHAFPIAHVPVAGGDAVEDSHRALLYRSKTSLLNWRLDSR